MTARIRVPVAARKGEVLRIGLLIQHPMETGYRADMNGARIAKNAIRSLVCRYNGVEVFRAELSPGIAANPFIEFTTVALESGELEFNWVDDAGKRESATGRIRVA